MFVATIVPYITPTPLVIDSVNTAATAGFAGLFMMMWLLIMLLSIGSMILWVVALVKILTRSFKEPNDKLIWALVVIFIPVVGPLLYFFIGAKRK